MVYCRWQGEGEGERGESTRGEIEVAECGLVGGG